MSDLEAADALEAGRQAHQRRAWDDAYQAFARADQSTPLTDIADVERFALSAALTGRDEAFLGLLERAYHLTCDSGAFASAARFAFWLGFRLGSLGEAGRAAGWLSRAQRLLERHGGECAVSGYLLLPAILQNLSTGDLDLAMAAAKTAAAIGERFADADLFAFARQLEGRALLKKGHIDMGLPLLDEAMVAATGDELSPIVTGLVYCGVIASCHEIYALSRAREWTEALARWCASQSQLVPFTGACQVHRAEIMMLGGAWGDALHEARSAAEGPARGRDRTALAGALYQQAEVHRLRGEYDEAEDAYRRASDAGREPQPGLALLRLAQGRRSAAVAAIERILGTTRVPLARARLLPAAVEVFLGAADLDAADRASSELDEIADAINAEALHAAAAQARGAVLTARGDAAAALNRLRRALAGWQQLDAPYLAARTRVLIAEACRILGDRDAVTFELDAARNVFQRLGAASDLAALDRLATARKSPGQALALTARELEVLRLVSTGKTNKEIARQLGLSEKTVDRHVSNMFVKLNVSTRAAATAFAYEHQLV